MYHVVNTYNTQYYLFPLTGKFLPMKTMLGPRYDDQVAAENRFHPSMLSNLLKSLKVRDCEDWCSVTLYRK